MVPDNRWDAEAFLGFRGLPWDVTADAVPSKPRTKVMVHFALPPDEVVPQPDGALTTPVGELPLEALGDEDESSGPAPTTPLSGSGQGYVCQHHRLARGLRILIEILLPLMFLSFHTAVVLNLSFPLLKSFPKLCFGSPNADVFLEGPLQGQPIHTIVFTSQPPQLIF